MTAWTAMVIPIWILAKCGVDFIVLEYGNKFQLIDDSGLACVFAITCGIAIFVDLVNCYKTIRDI